MLAYVTIEKFSAESGYTTKAIRHKIDRKDWAEGKIWVKAPDGRILISIHGYHAWVETVLASGKCRRRASKSNSAIKGNDAGRELSSTPAPLQLI